VVLSNPSNTFYTLVRSDGKDATLTILI